MRCARQNQFFGAVAALVFVVSSADLYKVWGTGDATAQSVRATRKYVESGTIYVR